MKRFNQIVAILAIVLLMASVAERQATAQLANPLSSADGYEDSLNNGYSVTKIGSPSFTSIAGTGTPVDTGDDGNVDVPIGFDFGFFGATYSDVQVSGNALAYLGTGYAVADFYLPGGNPNGAHPEDNGGSIRTNYSGPLVAFGWDDWNVGDALTTGGIFSQTRGSAGSREFVVEFDSVARFAGDPRGVDSLQMIFHEGSNEISMHFPTTDGPYDNGLAIGIQGDEFTYLQALYLDGDASVGTGKPANGEALLWTPPVNPPTMNVTINRADGRVTMTNNTGVAQNIKGYEISSLEGEFNPGVAPFLADSDANWVQLSADDGGDLSEGHLTTGVIAAGATVDFGAGSWQPYFKEEAEFKFIDASGNTLRGPLTYVGDAGAGDGPFAFIDLNFDGTINIQDWVTFRNNVGNDLDALATVAQLYRNSDLNGDRLHSTRDFVIFAENYDAANGIGAFAAIQGVPEPSTLALMTVMGLGGALTRRRRRQQHCRIAPNIVAPLATKRVSPLVALLAAVGCLLLPSLASAQLPLFFENFDSLPYGPTVEEVGARAGDNVWTDVAPDGWVIDRSNVPGFDEPADNNGVQEWIGWNFANRDWWAAEGQNRAQFTNARGGIMVADPDEWDDATHPDSAANGWYETEAVMPPVAVTGLPANVVRLQFDSSWRPEFDSNFQQSVAITASFDGGPDTEILRWLSDPASPDFHPDATNEEIAIDIANPAGANELTLKYRMFDAGNDWWWAIDNLEVIAVGDPLNVEVNKTTGEIRLTTGDLPSVFSSYNIVSESGALDGPGWEAGNLASAAAGGGSPADTDGDGDVDGADYLNLTRAGASLDDWKQDFGGTNFGSPGEQFEVLNGSDNQLFEANLLGTAASIGAFSGQSIGIGYDTSVGSEDLTFVYTTPSGSEIEGTVSYIGGIGGVSSVPEPSSLVLSALAAAGVVLRRRRTSRYNDLGASMIVSTKPLLALGTALTCLAMWTASTQAQTNERLYNLGEAEPNDGAGSVVGSGSGSFGVTWDDAGQPNMNQFQDLTPVGSPTYATVSGRPDGGSGLGVEFNGASSQYLRAVRVGAPSTTVTSTTQAGGTLDYFDLNNRGMAFWVQPGAADGPQSIVMDTNQHGVRINDSENFSMRYGGVEFDTNVAATPGTWFHVEVVQTAGGGAQMYIDGNGAASATGGYNVADEAPLVVGANTRGTLSSFEGGTEEFFTGIVDELSIFVLGTSDAGTSFGEYDFVSDNARAIDVLGASPNLADINRDGSVSGNGTGPAASDDVTAFVNGWQFRNFASGRLLGGLNTISRGDINVDGIVNIDDWALINAASPAVGAAILNSLAAVPEPSSCLLAIAGLMACVCRRTPR